MQVLDQERVAQLVAAARAGELPDPPDVGQRRGARVRTIDFSRPTKFGADHQRHLRRTSEAFCQAAATRLSAELRWPVELEVLGTVQLTWTAIQAQIAPRSMFAVLELQPVDTRILMTIEQSLVFVGLECQLGGTPERPARDRRLSEIDWSLAHAFIGSLVTPLSLAWQELAGVSVEPVAVDAHETSQLAQVSEPTLGIQIELRINQQSYAITLLIPWSSFAPVDKMTATRDGLTRANGRSTPPLRRAMGSVPVTVRAEVGHALMSMREVLALSPGSVITFDSTVSGGVELFADAVPIAAAAPGRQGLRRAAQITNGGSS